MLSSEDEVQAVLRGINKVQETSEVKLNAFYTIVRQYARTSMNHIISKQLILHPSRPIPEDSLVRRFDEYFRSNLQDFYMRITNNGEEIYIPTQEVI